MSETNQVSVAPQATTPVITQSLNADDLAKSLLGALESRTQRAQNGVIKSFVEQHGMSESAVLQLIEEEKTKQLASTLDVTQTESYKKLEREHEAYKARVELKGSENFKDVKSKFFDTVYEKLDHSKDYVKQLEAIRTDYDEYFTAIPPAAIEPTIKVSSGMPHGAPLSNNSDAELDQIARKAAGLK